VIRVAVEIGEHAVVRRVRITAESIERALSMVGKDRPEREVRLVFPIEAERFFAGNESGKQKGESQC
jgi:hypothetical protein